ncbi:MAG: hypothetical protein V7641_4814 [Blastocatellia bacterium]
MVEELDEKKIRQYLLGELAEAEMSSFEERLMTDDELFKWLLVVEDELIDERAAEELSAEEQARFDSYFLATPQRRERLQLAYALHDYADRHADKLKLVANPTSGAANEAANAARSENPSEPVKEVPAPAPLIRPERWSSRQYLTFAAAAVILIAVGFGVWPIISYRLDVSRGMAALNQAYTENPTVARITGLNYQPHGIERGGDDSGKINKLALEQARGLLASAANQHPNAITYQAVGRLYLAQREFDDAIKYFEEALKLDESNAELHSDLGAALLEKGKVEQTKGESGKSFEEFGQSNEHLSKALELKSSLLEALFNRALCREYLKLYDLAKEDWENYIKEDSNSKWADEARQRLKTLEERPPLSSQNMEQLFQQFLQAYKIKDDEQVLKIMAQSRDLAGSFVENQLLNEYLDLTAKGLNDEAREKLEALSYVGRLEYKQTRDLFILDLVGFYQSATASQRAKILQARSLIKRGRESASTYNFNEALAFYKRAKELFDHIGDQCEALYVTYPIGSCYVQQSKAESALALFQPLAQASERGQYKHLLAQTLGAMANANMYLREFSAAIENSERSMNLSKEIGDTSKFLDTFFQLAEENRFVNNCQKALDLHVQNLSLAYVSLPEPAELWARYFSISLTFYQLNLYTTAIDFQKEALRLALEAGKPRLICRTYNYLGMLLAKYGNYTEATANIERALEIGNTFMERKVRIEATAPSFLQLGYIYRRLGDFNKAIENYDQAIQFYDELDAKFFNFTARKDKLLCCLDQGGCDSVEQDMKTLLSLFEEHRSKILEDSNRMTFFGAEQSIFDGMIEFEYFKKNEPREAFEYSEKGRGRSLRDLINTDIEIIDNPDNPDMKSIKSTPPIGIEEIQSRMPQQAQILQYAVLKNSILIWVLSKDNFYYTSQSVSIEDLDGKVNHFLQLIANASEDDSEAVLRDVIALYDLLIKPVKQWLDDSNPLCIVPDKILNFIPFAALRSQASGRYFIEERERGFVLSPSANLFVTCSETAREKRSSESERLLSVGDPLFERGETYSNFDELQSAAREAETIARYYGSSPALTGAAATKKRVMGDMEQADVIHLATHAITNEWYPLRSKLLLAKDVSGGPGKADDGILQAYEIYKLKLARAKLVVLSACRSGVETYYGGEGMVGLSRPFIARRIPLVVASLWPVNSASTADLMINFHRHRKSGGGMPTAEALRQAQIDMLRDANSDNRLPYHWAAFVAIGGYANF